MNELLRYIYVILLLFQLIKSTKRMNDDNFTYHKVSSNSGIPDKLHKKSLLEKNNCEYSNCAPSEIVIT